MDDSRTQRTLDALADLYLTGPDLRPGGKPDTSRSSSHPKTNSATNPNANSATSDAGSTHSAANTGPSDSAPLRLPPKLRIRHAPAPSPLPSYTPAVAAATTGPARPWREVRQERRDQFAAQRDEDNAADQSTENTDDTGDLQGALAAHMPLAQPPAADDMADPNETAEQDRDPHDPHDSHDLHDLFDEHTIIAREDQEPASPAESDGESDGEFDDDHNESQDHSPYAFPASASRSRDIAASGVMTDEADGSRWRQSGAIPAAQAVYLGNLPGFAGPWLAQYAQLHAVRKQRVAIIHVADELAEVQLVSPLGMPAAEPVRQGESIVDLFERLAGDRTCPLAQWLVHLPMPLSEESKELGHDFDCWTLLTGADDAAVASGVQWLQKMLDDDRRHAYRQVGVSVMGSDPSRGQEVAKRINAVARGLLQQPVALRQSRRQMAPVNIQTVAVFAPAMEMWAEMTAYLTSFDASEVFCTSPAASPTSATPATSTSATSDADAAAQTAASIASEIRDDTFRIPDSRRVSPQRQSPSQLKAMQSETPAAPVSKPSAAPVVEPVIVQAPVTPAAEYAETVTASTTATAAEASTTPQASETKSASSQTETFDYVRWITPGALLLEARCPYKPAVQIALDQQGLLHVLAGSADTDNRGRSPREIAMDLLEVRQWAVDHLSLLCLTQRQCRFDLEAEPVVHLFATDGIAATTMARSLGASIKLHLMQQAHIGSQSTWVASPLN